MKITLPKTWLETLEILDIAFQPILNIHTGKIFGVESLLRNYQEAGFKSIFSVFDQAFHDGILYNFDIALREKTFKKYKTIHDFENIKLFYNLDNRLFECPYSSNSNTKKILKSLDIKQDNIFFEISERHEISSTLSMNKVLQHYKNESYSIAIDDFGVGFSGYKLLYDTTPDVLKIDRFFLQDIEKNMKKKLMVRNITHLAIQLGIKVVAEGVETEAELLTCKDIGCHLVQGYLVQKPTQNTNKILKEYIHIKEVIQKNKRANRAVSKIDNYLDKTISFDINTKLPGNTMIEKYISKSLNTNTKYLLCYFDLDNFKAFNDVYGFRNGDRVIQLFADIMRKELSKNFFIAHIGGDDFFCAKGYITSKNREAKTKNFPLLTVSASVLVLEHETKKRSSENINKVLSSQKKVAKNESKHISISSLL